MTEAEFKTYALSDGIVYGPVASRRLGISLGINILPFGVKVCSFNCNYCQCGWTTDLVDPDALAKYRFPTAEEVRDEVVARLKDLKAAGTKVECLTLAGNGEPTLHPDFLPVVRALLSARDEAMPGVRVDILSNAAHLDRPAVIEGLGFSPRGEESQIYSLAGHDLCLIGTAEITLGGMYADSIFSEEELPLKLAGISHCFRTEAGAHGRESRGLYRVHQFSKVEMFVFCRPEDSEAQHQELLRL